MLSVEGVMASRTSYTLRHLALAFFVVAVAVASLYHANVYWFVLTGLFELILLLTVTSGCLLAAGPSKRFCVAASIFGWGTFLLFRFGDDGTFVYGSRILYQLLHREQQVEGMALSLPDSEYFRGSFDHVTVMLLVFIGGWIGRCFQPGSGNATGAVEPVEAN